VLVVLALLVAISGLCSTLVALWPPDRPQVLVGFTFAPSLLLGEWSPQALVVHLITVGVLTPWLLDHTLGRVALGVASLTALGLVWLTIRQIAAWRARPGMTGPSLTPVAKLTTFPFRPRDIEKIRNIPYADRDGRTLRVDVYRRQDHPTGAPVLLQVHGGAWVMGRKDDQGLPLMHLLARRGWVCFAVEYRLSPKATYPDHLVDVKEALAWVRAHAAEYGGDADRIVITGGSAGGHLASLAALTPGFEQPGFEDADTAVAGCVAFYGVYDFTDRLGHWKGRGLDRLLVQRVMKDTIDAARDVYDTASPMSRITADAPPFLLVHGTADTLVPVVEAREMARLLKATSGQAVTLLEVPHAQHAFESLPSLRTRAVLEHVVRFVDEVTSRQVASTDLTDQPAATEPEIRTTA
jgi:acetyl esterase/lipase